MNYNLSNPNNDVQCVYYKQQKYRFLRVMPNGYLSFKCVRKFCFATIELDQKLKAIVCSSGEHLQDCINNIDFKHDTPIINKVEKHFQNIDKPSIIKDHVVESQNSIILVDDDDEVTQKPQNTKKRKLSPIVQNEAPKQNFEMSRKKYANCDEFSYDDDGNEIINICQQTNKVCQDQGSSVPEEAEENNASYKYIYPRSDLKGPTIDNETQYQYINAPSNNIEHNSSSNYKASSSIQKTTVKQPDLAEWKDEELTLMLKRYKEYVPNVGKDKRFKSRRALWTTIAEEVNTTFKVGRSWNQCLSKFHHFLKKTKKPESTFQDELESMDFIHEGVMEDLEFARINDLETDSTITETLGQVITKTMIELAKINAHAQERRHREYLEYIKRYENRFMENISKLTDKL